MLNIDNLCFGYDGGPCFRSHFFLDSGEMLHINGPNGVGKSSLLKAIAGLLPSRSGDILFQMKNVTNKPPHLRPVTVMFQGDNLFPGLTVEDNLKIVPKASMHTYRELIQSFDLEPLLSLKPAQLSSGQKQLVTWIRCFLHNQDIWLLDEPTSHLAKPLAEALVTRLREHCRREERHVIVVSHDEALFQKYTNDCREIHSIVQLMQ